MDIPWEVIPYSEMLQVVTHQEQIVLVVPTLWKLRPMDEPLHYMHSATRQTLGSSKMFSRNLFWGFNVVKMVFYCLCSGSVELFCVFCCYTGHVIKFFKKWYGYCTIPQKQAMIGKARTLNWTWKLTETCSQLRCYNSGVTLIQSMKSLQLQFAPTGASRDIQMHTHTQLWNNWVHILFLRWNVRLKSYAQHSGFWRTVVRGAKYSLPWRSSWMTKNMKGENMKRATWDINSKLIYMHASI